MLKKPPAGKKGKGLRALPKAVRNKMGFMKKGGRVKKRKPPAGKKGKGLRALPKAVRNKMGFMKKGGRVKKRKK
jgi:hypothetical protein